GRPRAFSLDVAVSMTKCLPGAAATQAGIREPRQQALLSRTFRVEVFLQVVIGHGAFDATRGHFEAGCPKQRIQDDLPEILVAPVLVEVRPGEAKAASAVGPFHCPSNNLLAPAGGEDMRIGPPWRG